jgi:predicted transcriptional regulator
MNVLLSIKPKFVERIFEGEKKYEYRKIMFANGNVKNIFVYASTPVKKIVGRIEIDEVLCEAPSMLWNLTADHAGISRAFFFEYFSDRNTAFAIKIKSAERYHEPLDPYNMIVGFRAPQSFMYLENGKLLNKLMHRTLFVRGAHTQSR